MKTIVLSTQHINGVVCNRRFPRRYMTDQGARLRSSTSKEARAQWRDKPLKGEVRMHVTLYAVPSAPRTEIISTN
jgi:hypothetical protein